MRSFSTEKQTDNAKASPKKKKAVENEDEDLYSEDAWKKNEYEQDFKKED